MTQSPAPLASGPATAAVTSAGDVAFTSSPIPSSADGPPTLVSSTTEVTQALPSPWASDDEVTAMSIARDQLPSP